MIEWPSLPPQEEIMAMFEEAKRETAFWIANYERHRHEYPDLWVAVRDGAVIDTDSEQEPLLARLRAAGLEWPIVWTDFVPKEPRSFILFWPKYLMSAFS
jgi:hypothetical protein